MIERRDVKEALLRKRTLRIENAIDGSDLDEITDGLIRLNLDSETEEIKLMINSNGGDIESSLSLVDIIRALKAPVTAIVIGKCMSSAVTILLACDKRIALRHALFQAHVTELTSHVKLDDNFELKIAEILKRGISLRAQAEAWYVSRTKLNAEQVRDLRNKGEIGSQVFTAEQALEYGFITEVLDHYEIF